MKKRNGFIIVLMLSLMLFAFYLHSVGRPYQRKEYFPEQPVIQLNQPEEAAEDDDENHTWTLPASILVIDDEAFEGTAIQSLELPETVTTVGDRAFANNKDLFVVRLMGHPEHIGDELFAGSEKAVMAVYAGSDTLNEVRGKGYRFYLVTSFSKQRAEKTFAMTIRLSSADEKSEKQRETCTVETKENRTGRTTAELKEDMYKGEAALYVRSRYFP